MTRLSILLLLLTLVTPFLASALTTTGLIGYMTMNDTSGDIRDIVSNVSLKATTLGYSNSGVAGTSLNFSGGFATNTSDQFSKYIGGVGNVNGNITVNMWVKLNAEIGATAYVFWSLSNGTTKRSFFPLYQYNSGTRRLGVELDKNGVSGDAVYQNVVLGTANWYMITVTKSDANMTIYLNGTYWASMNTTMTANGSAATNNGLYIGKREDNYGQSNTDIDEMSFWNYAMNSSTIEELYANGSGIFYPYNVTVPPAIPQFYTVSTVQVPNDINSTSIEGLTINASIIGNTSNTSTSTLAFKIHTTLSSNCPVIYQKTCEVTNDAYRSFPMTKINNSYYTIFLEALDYLPGVYPYNESIIEDTPHTNYSLYLNNYMRWLLTNFSVNTTQFFISLEFAAINQSTNAMGIYYCNSSYTTGNPVTSSNCELVDSFIPLNLSQHFHNFSSHWTIPITISTVTKTQNSSFIFLSSGNINNGWKFGYVTNPAYDNTSFQIGSYNSWTATSNIFDVHIHNFFANDYFSYYVTFNENGSGNTSSIVYDFYNITHYPPSAPIMLTPACSEQFTLGNEKSSIYFSWTNSTSLNNFSIFYNLDILTLLADYPLVTLLNVTNYNYTNLTSSVLNEGTYFLKITACDNLGFCDAATSCDFTVCVNDWTRTSQPCVVEARLVTYYDAHSCNQALDVPLDNGTYEVCTSIQQIKFTLQDDYLILIILAFFYLVSTACAITIHEAFFGLDALLIGCMWITFIAYDYPQILFFVTPFLVLVHVGMWILVSRAKR